MSAIDKLLQKIKKRDNFASAAAYDVAKWLLRWNLPDSPALRAFYRTAWYARDAAEIASELAVSKLVLEPMVRSRFHRVGERVHVEWLPYIRGHAKISVGDDCRLSLFSVHSGKWLDEPELVFGNRCLVAWGVSFTVNKRITIGNHVGIAGYATIADSDGHPTDKERRLRGEGITEADIRPVTIGNHVWIGRFAQILKGVTIGDGAVIAAGSVVASDVPEGALAMGVPARVLKQPW